LNLKNIKNKENLNFSWEIKIKKQK
jgi:hypothetical protein